MIQPRILLATLSLLAFGTSASAECAWVLWLEQTVLVAGQKELNWVTISASTNIQDCDQVLKATVQFQSRPAEGEKIERRAQNMVFRTTPTGMTTSARYVCLPDTVDPRGPRSK